MHTIKYLYYLSNIIMCHVADMNNLRGVGSAPATTQFTRSLKVTKLLKEYV